VAPPSVDAAGVARVRDAPATAADRVGGPFIDPLAGNWLVSADLFGDGTHPDDEGYAMYAPALVDRLHLLGV
jgi:lysophospholipase L1-like esterase